MRDSTLSSQRTMLACCLKLCVLHSLETFKYDNCKVLVVTLTAYLWEYLEAHFLLKTLKHNLSCYRIIFFNCITIGTGKAGKGPIATL